MKLILGLVLCLIATVAQAQPATQIYTGTPTQPVGLSNPLAVTSPLPAGAATAANQINGSQQTQVVGTVPLPTGAATAANQTNGSQVTQIAGTVTVTAAGAATAANQTNGSQVVKPAARTIVLLDVSAVTTGSIAVTALAAGHATAGGVLVTANAAGMCIDQHTTAGTVTGTPSTTICVPQNVVFNLVPNSGAVSVNSTAAISFGGEGLN